MTDDGSQQVNLSGGKSFSFFGTPYASFYVGANGYVTFGQGSSAFTVGLDAHFDVPRISGVMADLDPSGNARVSWQQLADRAVVSWENIRDFTSSKTNSFQIEMFFDGRVRVTDPEAQVVVRDGMVVQVGRRRFARVSLAN